MSHCRPNALPDSLEPPDVGFVAATGAYAAVVFTAAAVTAALAVSGTAASVLGSVSTAATIGLVVGAALMNRRTGLPERLGRRTRSLAPLFVAPVAFAGLTALVLGSSIPDRVAFGTWFGAVATLLVAVGLASMARTRYARAMTPEEPTATIPLLNPVAAYAWLAGGGVSIAVSILSFLRSSDLFRGRLTWWFGLFGLYACLLGLAYWSTTRGADDASGATRGVNRLLSAATWLEPDRLFDPQTAPELRVHEAGLVAKRPFSRRLIQWEAVTNVRRTPTELVIERRDWFDLRCARSVIDDPEGAREAIERARRDAERTGT